MSVKELTGLPLASEIEGPSKGAGLAQFSCQFFGHEVAWIDKDKDSAPHLTSLHKNVIKHNLTIYIC